MLRRSLAVVVLGASGVLASASPSGAFLPAAPPDDLTVVSGNHLSGGPAAVKFSDDVYYRVASTNGQPRKVRYLAAFEDLNPADTTVLFSWEGSSTSPANCLIEIFNYDTRSWDVFLGITSTPTTDVGAGKSLPADLYVNNDGEAKMRVTCTSTAGAFTLRTDAISGSTFTP